MVINLTSDNYENTKKVKYHNAGKDTTVILYLTIKLPLHLYTDLMGSNILVI